MWILAGEDQCLNSGIEGGPDQSEGLPTGHSLQPGCASRMQQDGRDAVQLHGKPMHGICTTISANMNIAGALG